jgi:hypothetical protein
MSGTESKRVGTAEVGMAYPNENAEQNGADQAATDPESKSEGSEKPEPESEGRSQ